MLTLDKHIQHVVETELSRSYRNGEPRRLVCHGSIYRKDLGAWRIIPPSTQISSFNTGQDLEKSGRFRIFEPGSMFKVFLAATALEEKVTRSRIPTLRERSLHGL